MHQRPGVPTPRRPARSAEEQIIAGLKRALAARFSPELPDLTIYVIDVPEGENIAPRRGGPGITRSDLLVINKIDLAPLVGADLGVMEADALKMRLNRPFVFTDLRSGEEVEQIAMFIIKNGGLEKAAA